MIRLILGIIIVLGCGYLGIYYSSDFKVRVSSIEELKTVLQRLEFNISFMNLPLGDAIYKMLATQTGSMQNILKFVANEIKSDRFQSMERIWQEAFENYGNELKLKKEDVEIILEFSKNLGKGDRQSEINNIRAALARLELKHEEAVTSAKENVRLFRSIGLSCGVFIAIILI